MSDSLSDNPTLKRSDYPLPVRALLLANVRKQKPSKTELKLTFHFFPLLRLYNICLAKPGAASAVPNRMEFGIVWKGN